LEKIFFSNLITWQFPATITIHWAREYSIETKLPTLGAPRKLAALFWSHLSSNEHVGDYSRIQDVLSNKLPKTFDLFPIILLHDFPF